MRRIAFALILFLFSCTTVYNPATGKKEFYFINTETEVLLGKSFRNHLLLQKLQVKDKRLIELVRSIGSKIAQVCDRKGLEYHFYVLKDKEINAFALPGGFIFVNRGLLDIVSKDELAFVLGHEIAHVCCRHAIKRLQVSLGYDLIISLALGKSRYIETKRALNLMYELISLGYSRQDELMADSLGVKYAFKAGFNPKGALSFLKKLKKKENCPTLLVILRSHPPIDKRIENIISQIHKLENLKNSSQTFDISQDSVRIHL